jgi:hypothetical protein
MGSRNRLRPKPLNAYSKTPSEGNFILEIETVHTALTRTTNEAQGLPMPTF